MSRKLSTCAAVLRWICWVGLAAATFACAPAALGATYLEEWAKMKPITPHSYLCHRAAQRVQIDGRLDDAAWLDAAWTEDFTDIEGAAKPPPRFRTRAKMLWDENYFYFAAELEEPHVWATLTNRDAVIFQDNDFEVFIDPDGDTHDYFEFELNALNTGWDLLLKKPYKDGGPALNSWDIRGLKTAVRVQGTLNSPRDRDTGWTLEIAIPWRAMAEFAGRPAPPQEGDQWRVNFSRVEWPVEVAQGNYKKLPGRREDNWVWSPQGIIDMHRPEKWGYVQFTRRRLGRGWVFADPAAPARDVLQEIYYAQKDFRKREHRWATSLRELSLPATWPNPWPQPPTLQPTADGFTASLEVELPTGLTERWHIRQDAKVWME
jgi:hypothetical protein